jgi:hypothetical protein
MMPARFPKDFAWRAGVACLAVACAVGAAPPPPLTPGAVASLIEELGDEDFARRQEASRHLRAQAARDLGAFEQRQCRPDGGQAVPALRRAVLHTDPEVRRRVRDILLPVESAWAKLHFKRRGIDLTVPTTVSSEPGVGVHFREWAACDADLEVVSGLPHVTSLSFSRGECVTDGGIAFLKRLSELRRLDIAAPLTDAGLAHLGERPRLEYLSLSGPSGTGGRLPLEVTGTGFRRFKSRDSLRELSLYHLRNRWTDEGVAQIARFRNLEGLSLASEHLTDRSLQMIAGLSKLKGLILESPHLTDAGLRQLKRLQELKVVQVTGQRISRKAVADLESALPRLRKP